MLKKLQFALKIIHARIARKNIPLCVGIHITSSCNFNCIYCYGGYSNKQTPEFTTDQILKLIEELSQLKTKWITLTGGEPLLRDDIELIIDKIKEKNIICSMNTNGSLIEEKISAVKKLDFITVSIDGTKNSNDLNRGEGTFEKIIGGINCLKKHKIPFDAVAVITKFNSQSKDIDELLDLAKKNNFLIEFNFLQDQDIKQQNHNSFAVSDEDIKKITKKLIHDKTHNRPVYYTTRSRKYLLKWPTSYNTKIIFDPLTGFKPIHCYMGQLMCHIDANGLVYPCIQLAGKFKALSFLDNGFKAAWNNLQNNKKCQACYALCYTEFNRFFNLDLDVWLNNIKQLLQKKQNLV